MEMENVEAIKAQLLRLGFDERLEEKLMAQICFARPSFDLRFDKVAGEDACSFIAHVMRVSERYKVDYYNAHFRKGFALGKSLDAFLSRMGKIDWQALGLSVGSFGSYMELPMLIDAHSLLREITAVPENGLLLYKYWAGTSLESMVPDVVTLKNKYELSQRFYVSEEHQPITADEAMRFLQNRWMERTMQQSRLQQRQADGGNNENNLKKNGKRKSSRKK